MGRPPSLNLRDIYIKMFNMNRRSRFWSSGPGGRAGPGIAMMSAVRLLSYDPASASLVTNPAPWYSKMHNETLVDESGKTQIPPINWRFAKTGSGHT